MLLVCQFVCFFGGFAFVLSWKLILFVLFAVETFSGQNSRNHVSDWFSLGFPEFLVTSKGFSYAFETHLFEVSLFFLTFCFLLELVFVFVLFIVCLTVSRVFTCIERIFYPSTSCSTQKHVLQGAMCCTKRNSLSGWHPLVLLAS